MHPSLRTFLDRLTRENEIITIKAEVDPYLELAEIHRRVIEQGGPALLFERVKGSRYSVVTNMFGTERRIELAFGSKPRSILTSNSPRFIAALSNKAAPRCCSNASKAAVIRSSRTCSAPSDASSLRLVQSRKRSCAKRCRSRSRCCHRSRPNSGNIVRSLLSC